MCGYRAMATGFPVSCEHLVAQIDSFLEQPGALDDVGEWDLYNSGSFFADDEIPAEARQQILERMGRTDVLRVLVESRPEHLTHAKLMSARASLGPKVLEVGIGLESANDYVRDTLINKGFGKPEFERALDCLRAGDAGLLVYLLIKPPGLDESAAVADAIDSAKYVFEAARRASVPARIAFEPVFVAPGTELEREFQAGRYRPPSLWSVVEVVRQTHALGELHVGLSEEGLGVRGAPEGCPLCTPRLRDSLRAYNQKRDLSVFDGLDCDCATQRGG
jgi:hypothetical protein